MPENFEVVDDYLISYDGDYFDLHKPSDVRSLVKVVNYVVKEKEQLKKEVLGQSEEIEILSDENEQLKEKIKALEDTNTGLIETIAHFDITEVL